MTSRFGNKLMDQIQFAMMAVVLMSTAVITRVGAAEKIVWTQCPNGWETFKTEVPHTCVKLSSGTTTNMVDAHDECVSLGASHMVWTSSAKYEAFKDLILTKLGANLPVWTGIQKRGKRVYWLTKDGKVPTKWIPKELDFDFSTQSYGKYNPDFGDYNRGLVFMNHNLEFANSHDAAHYVCEKRLACVTGRFGKECEKECRCFGQKCDATASEVTCENGCFLGWMGKDCTQRKADSDVKYVCVDSEESGEYVRISITNKGVAFRNINPVNEEGDVMNWCNARIEHKEDEGVMTIELPVNMMAKAKMSRQQCAGEKVATDKYQWLIRLQENDGLVSRNDREIKITCDFTKAMKTKISKQLTIKREKNFRPKDVRRKVEAMSVRREEVKMDLVNPSNGRPHTKAVKLGTPVALKFSFGDGLSNVATGVIPYNCKASNVDHSSEVLLVDSRGCPIDHSPITQFTRQSARVIMSNPFTMFGIKLQEKVSFTCSYKLCFGNDPCLPNCDEPTAQPETDTTIRTTWPASTSDTYNYNDYGDSSTGYPSRMEDPGRNY